MSKKKAKKIAPPIAQQIQEPTAPTSFGFDEMLSELEAIIAEAEIRLQDEENVV